MTGVQQGNDHGEGGVGLEMSGVRAAAEIWALAGKGVVDGAPPPEDGSKRHCLKTAKDNWQAWAGGQWCQAGLWGHLSTLC